MFKFLGKMIKWAVITVVVIVVAMLVWVVIDPEGSGWNESSLNTAIELCDADHGETNCDAEGNTTAEYKVKQEEKMAAYEKAKKAQEVYDAKQKAKASRISSIKTNGRLMCRHTIKQRVKYPSKLDYDWNYEERLWENFNKDNASFPHRYSFNASGEMMNGFGNMVPFTVHCKLDLPASGNGRIVDFWIK